MISRGVGVGIKNDIETFWMQINFSRLDPSPVYTSQISVLLKTEQRIQATFDTQSIWVLIRFPPGIWVLDFRIFKYNGLLVGSLSVHPWRNLYSLHWESSRIFLCQVKSVHQVFTRYTGKISWQKLNSQRKTVLNTFYFNFNQRVLL